MKSYELAFRMQMAVPEVVSFASETQSTLMRTASIKNQHESLANKCSRQDVSSNGALRFVQVYHGSNGGAGSWDAHANLKASTPNFVVKPISPSSSLDPRLETAWTAG